MAQYDIIAEISTGKSIASGAVTGREFSLSSWPAFPFPTTYPLLAML
jgi:hypothetical protein